LGGYCIFSGENSQKLSKKVGFWPFIGIFGRFWQFSKKSTGRHLPHCVQAQSFVVFCFAFEWVIVNATTVAFVIRRKITGKFSPELILEDDTADVETRFVPVSIQQQVLAFILRTWNERIFGIVKFGSIFQIPPILFIMNFVWYYLNWFKIRIR